ncbi:MAG: hypothetical protein GXO50_03055 [Chlorobi bacterium]|nr:hypothetical protein [Chlorobiota bacterium]
MTEQLPAVKKKTFWQRPEGKTGALFLAAGAVALVIYRVPVINFIKDLIKDTAGLVILGAAASAVLYILFDKRARNLVWYMYKGLMRRITSLFVQTDPIKILENYVEYLKKNMRKMNMHITQLKGQISQLRTIIVKNKQEMEHSIKLAEQAKKQGKNELITLNTRQYGRLKESNERYEKLLNKMEVLYKVLNKIYVNSGYLIQDTENDVRMRKQELKAIKTSHSAMKRAMSVIQGDPDKKLIFDMATESVVEDIHNKISEMERFIEVSGSFIDSIDLQNGIYEQEGLEILEKFEKEGSSFLFGEPEKSNAVISDKNDEVNNM